MSTFRSPDTATASTEYSAGYAAINTINGSGLPAVFDENDLHDVYLSGNHWTTSGSAPLDQFIDWGFNSPQDLDTIFIWNHQSPVPPASNNGYDVTLFDLTLFDSLDNVLLSLDDVPLQPNSNASQTFSFGSVVSDVSRVRFDIEGVESSPNFTGLAEVGFNVVSEGTDDAIFAHDFENVTGDTIVALRGPDATKTSNIITDTIDPVRLSSTQHLQAPDGSAFATIDTNTRLLEMTSELSFSIFYNDRGDNGRDDPSNSNAARLLSSYNGTGTSSPNELILDLISSSGRRLRFSTAATQTLSSETIPFRDGMWHQAGFVFDSGTVTFYFDGSQLGDSITIPGVTSIQTQNRNWFLIEDARAISAVSEYFDSGDYDEAALWNRALSAQEMNALYEQGINAVDDAYEPNNSVGEAFPLEPWTSLSNVGGNGIQKDLDYYEFTIPDNHRLIALLRDDISEGNLGLAVVNASNRVLLAQNTRTDNEVIQAVAPTGFGGTYYLTVFGQDAGTEYDLYYATVPVNSSNLDLSGQYQLGKTEQFNMDTSLDSPYLDSSILEDYSSSISSSSSIFESLT